MKTFLFSVTILSCLFSHSSFAAGPVNPIPGAPMELEKNALELLTVLTQKEVASDFAYFLKSGNKITSASVQFISPTLTVYSLTIKDCTSGGVTGDTCLSGARLDIRTDTKPGNIPSTSYRSKFTYLASDWAIIKPEDH